MINLEIKCKAIDLKELEGRAKLFADFSGILNQKDTYYITGKTRLKLREENDKLSRLIYYKREDKIENKKSKYYIWEFSKFTCKITKAILKFIFSEKIIVQKDRKLYIYKNTRIHLDNVKNIGRFIELETVVKDEKNIKEYQQEHGEVVERLKLNKLEKIKGSYSDF